MTISHRIFLRMINVSNKRCRRNESAHFISSNFFFSSENRAVFEIISKKVVEPERPQMTIWRRVAYWISKTTRQQAHSCARAPTHTHTRTYSPTNARTRAHTHTDKYVIPLLSHANSCFSNAPHCYVIRPWSVLLSFSELR